jgi:hypothetical protein
LVIGNTVRNDHNYDLEVLGQGKMLISSGDTVAGGSGVIYFPKDGSFYLREAGTNADSAYGANSVSGYTEIFRAWASGEKVGAKNYCDISGANCFTASEVSVNPLVYTGGLSLNTGDSKSTGVSVVEDGIYKIYINDGGGPSYPQGALEATIFGAHGGGAEIKLIHNKDGLFGVSVTSGNIYITNNNQYTYAGWYVERLR